MKTENMGTVKTLAFTVPMFIEKMQGEGKGREALPEVRRS